MVVKWKANSKEIEAYRRCRKMYSKQRTKKLYSRKRKTPSKKNKQVVNIEDNITEVALPNQDVDMTVEHVQSQKQFILLLLKRLKILKLLKYKRVHPYLGLDSSKCHYCLEFCRYLLVYDAISHLIMVNKLL